MGDPGRLTPSEFEALVEELLRISGVGLSDFKVKRLETIQGLNGEYNIDITARFKALGANFLVLIECKHHKNPIKRELVQVLNDKVCSTAAQKGMMFTTSSYQRGALKYAKVNGIALVRIIDGKTTYETKGYGVPIQVPDWVPEFVSQVISATESGWRTKLIIENRPEFILEEFEINGS
ncbi:MAG: restriction endonuclease [Actinomycetota bacterium]|nr:restriction endonuclease [Actinomycetota bacterium]